MGNIFFRWQRNLRESGSIHAPDPVSSIVSVLMVHSLQQSAVGRARRIPEDGPREKGFHQSFAKCLWRSEDTTMGNGEPLPVHMTKDEGHQDTRLSHTPQDCQILTSKTAAEDDHEQTDREVFQQAHAGRCLSRPALLGRRRIANNPVSELVS